MLLPVLALAFSLQPAAQEPPAAPPPEPTSAESAAPAPAPTAEIEAGLTAFKRHRFRQAQSHFQKALEEDPQSAAANFYLGYTVYKIAEPKRPFHPEKQRAAELFAKAYELDPQFKPVWGPRH